MKQTPTCIQKNFVFVKLNALQLYYNFPLSILQKQMYTFEKFLPISRISDLTSFNSNIECLMISKQKKLRKNIVSHFSILNNNIKLLIRNEYLFFALLTFTKLITRFILLIKQFHWNTTLSKSTLKYLPGYGSAKTRYYVILAFYKPELVLPMFIWNILIPFMVSVYWCTNTTKL